MCCARVRVAALRAKFVLARAKISPEVIFNFRAFYVEEGRARGDERCAISATLAARGPADQT